MARGIPALSAAGNAHESRETFDHERILSQSGSCHVLQLLDDSHGRGMHHAGDIF